MGKPSGRADEPEAFGPKALAKLEQEFGVRPSEQLRRDLNALAVKYRHIAKSVPSKLRVAPDQRDLSKQIQWLDDNAIKPVETLLKALTVDRHLLRTAMSPELDQKLEIEQLVPMLKAHLDRADEVRIEMEQQTAHGVYNKDQLQYEVASELFDTLGRWLGDSLARRGMARHIEAALRIGCSEILGQNEQINSIVKAVRTGRMRSQLE